MKMEKSIKPDWETTEKMMIESGYHQLSGEEIKQRIAGKTILGDYLHGFKYITFIDPNGTMEGKNHVGAHHFGEWFIDMDDNTFTVKWDFGWDNTTTYAYDVNGEIKFYDKTTSQWRTTFKKFETGKMPLTI